MANQERYIFVVDWFDQMASLIRKYQLVYYPSDKTIEMFDIKNKKLFLRRCEYPQITLADLYINATVTIYSRQLKVVEYGDLFTKKQFEARRGRTFILFKPDVYTQFGKLLDIVYQQGFTVSKMKIVKLSPLDAQFLYEEHRNQPYFGELMQFMSGDLSLGLEVVGENAIEHWRAMAGPSNPITAKAEKPNSIRAIFGTDSIRNAVHIASDGAAAKREIDYFFSPKLRSPATINNCTCCIIKPHAITSGQAGIILDHILEEGFEVSALEMFYLDRPIAEEFFEVYRGVLPEYTPMVEQMTSGPCIALEVRSQENTVQAFREVAGPLDPEIAKTLRQNTIRAKCGVDRVCNAVHCTDLPEDGVLECEYFFVIMQEQQ